MKKTLSILLGAMSALSVSAAAQTVAITNGQLHVVGDAGSPRTVDNGTVLIRDGRIVSVGTNVSVPEDATVIDAAGRPVTPGVFAALSSLGLEEVSASREGNDTSADGNRRHAASLRAVDGINSASTVIGVSRRGGVTRAFSVLSPSDSLFAGCGALVVLDGSRNPVTDECTAHMMVLGYSGAARAGGSRPAALAMARRAMDDARAAGDSLSAYRDRVGEDTLSVADARALAPVVGGRVPMIVQAHSVSDILRVLDFAEDYDLDLVIAGGAEAHLVADDLARADVPVIIDPMANLPSSFERLNATLNSAAQLEAAGVRVSIANADTHNLRLLPQLAGNAVANGMSHAAALAAITAEPARLFGVDDELGTLAPGKLGDVVVWSGDPLEVTSRPDHVFVSGQEMSLEDRHMALASRYRNLSRGDLPHAYTPGGDTP